MSKKEIVHRKKLVLLDAHAIIHRAYHAISGLTSPTTGEPTGALYGVITMLLKIAEELKPDYIVACFDLPQPTYRHEVYEDYKAGRQKAEDDLVSQLERARDVIDALGIPRYEAAGFEADDILGTIVEQLKDVDDIDIVIASGDMDTMQLVNKKRVQVYTLKKGINDTIMYDEAAVKARYGFSPKLVADYKGLRGDPSDNIPGIRGIGEKTATTLISTFGSVKQMYKKLKKDEQQFLDVGITKRIMGLLKDGEDEAEFSQMLATIRRDAPVTFSIPEKTWREGVDVDVLLDTCTELGFRSLIPRIKKDFGEEENGVEEYVDPEEVKKTALALWLIDSDITNPNLDDILAYARGQGLSPDFTSARECIFKKLDEDGLRELYEDIELPLREVLNAMQQRGVLLDVEYLSKINDTYSKELAKLEKKIYAHAGVVFNINSPKQLGEVLFDTLGIKTARQKRTATGQRSTRESELIKLKATHPIIPEVLRYRELQKLVSTYIVALPKLVGDDGRLHTHFMQAGTTTGRLASRDPNLQNIPTRSEEGRAIRHAFIAEKGYTLVALDYSQIELRLAAFMAEDTVLMEIFKNGEDIHAGVAARVFGVELNEVTSDMRRHAKIINFGIMYGMGVTALRENLGGDTTREEAQTFLNNYFETFPQLAEYLEGVKAYARTHGYTETLYKRRRYFPSIQSTVPFMRAQAERMAINAPIQGTEADVVRIAMVRAYAHFRDRDLLDDVRLILQIHDELIFEIREELVEKVLPEITAIMDNVIEPEIRHDVPLVVGVKQGKDWGSLEK